MLLKPVGSKVLARVRGVEQKSSSGLYVSEGAPRVPRTAEVVSVGDQATTRARPGDVVVFD
jgi:co-chaperonin GroES (HSP10)